jgi:hypothetical protein
MESIRTRSIRLDLDSKSEEIASRRTSRSLGVEDEWVADGLYSLSCGLAGYSRSGNAD